MSGDWVVEVTGGTLVENRNIFVQNTETSPIIEKINILMKVFITRKLPYQMI